MNEQDEKLVRQSKWSGRRVVLLYWFALAFVGTAAAAGLGATILDPQYKFEAVDAVDLNHDPIMDPWDADDCVACHEDEVAEWNKTWHYLIVGEFDPTDNALNGSKVSYNSTHFWRTPNSAFMGPRYWTYNTIYNATGQQCCMTTRWYNITITNKTTGEVIWRTTDVKYENFTNNIWDIGVSCAACHTEPGVKDSSIDSCKSCHSGASPETPQFMQSGHYNSFDDILASGGLSSLSDYGYVLMNSTNSTDYFEFSCVTCHDPMNNSLNINDESNRMSPWTNPKTKETFGPGGSQLRAATVNDLCGQCHNISLNTTGTLYLDPSNHTLLDCTDCHGFTYTPTTSFPNGTVIKAGTFGKLSHNWKYEGGAPGEVCGLCHKENASTVWTAMQGYIAKYDDTNMTEKYVTKLAAAEAKYAEAKSTPGVVASDLINAHNLIQEAKDLAKNIPSFHKPEMVDDVQDQLALALTKLDYAILEANDAIAGAVNPTVTVDNTVDHTVDNTVEVTTTTTAPAIGFLAIIGILGVVALFLRKRR